MNTALLLMECGMMIRTQQNCGQTSLAASTVFFGYDIQNQRIPAARKIEKHKYDTIPPPRHMAGIYSIMGLRPG
jgi:hypothetical protein